MTSLPSERILPAAVLLAVALFFQAPSLPAISTGGDYELDPGVLGASGGLPSTGGNYLSKGLAGQTVLPQNFGEMAAGEYFNRAGFYNPPRFTYQRTLPAVVNIQDKFILTLPAGSVEKNYFDININNEALGTPLMSDVSLANSRIVINEGELASPLSSNLAETYVFDEQSSWQDSFLDRGTLSMTYLDDNDDGVIDGTDPAVRVDTAFVWGIDPVRDVWVKIPPLEVDRTARRIVVPLAAPGVFAIIGTLDEAVKNVYAYPVPFRPNGPRAGTGPGLTGTRAGGITFSNLPQTGDIKIYTLDGLLVRKLAIPPNLVPAQLVWDVRNSSGETVKSDVYIWRVTSGSNSKTGKLMVIW